MAAELYTVQDALQALCGLQLLHPSALPIPQVLCMMVTLLRYQPQRAAADTFSLVQAVQR